MNKTNLIANGIIVAATIAAETAIVIITKKYYDRLAKLAEEEVKDEPAKAEIIYAKTIEHEEN